MRVDVRNNNVDQAIRVLKKKMLKEGILKELKRRAYYEKPSLKRQREHKENLKRCAKLKKQKERDGNF